MIPFLTKDAAGIPDSYGIEIFYINGKREELVIASHRLVENVRVSNPNGIFIGPDGQSRFDIVASSMPYYELIDTENKIHVLPLSSIQRLAFDKSYTDFLEAVRKQEAQNAAS